MYKLVLLLALATALLLSPVAAKPQLLLDYGYYAPSYVSAYSAPLTYSYPYAYTYTYPYAFYK